MNRRMSRQPTGGFTLIELVVVLAVLAVLGAVAIPQVQQLRNQARIQALASELASATEDSFAVQLREPNGWPNQWMVNKTGNDDICERLNQPSNNLGSPDGERGGYGIDEIPAGYKVVPAAQATDALITFDVPNAEDRQKNSDITSVTCAIVED